MPSTDASVRPYLLAALAVCVLLLALFGLAQLLEIPLLSDESPQLGGAGLGAGAASFALLVGDVVLPVPSGALAIVVTRPVPVVAETAAILAGATGIPLGRFAAAAAIGSLVPAIAYALAGAYAARFDAGLAVFAAVLALAAALWLAERLRRGRASTGG